MWNFLAEAMNGGMTSVVGHGDLLRKIHFPKITVTIASIMSALINFGINLIVMIFFILINGVHISFKAVLIIPIFAELLLIASGLAFFLGALFVNFRDLSPIWEVVLQAGFYATPIIYPISLVATNIGPQAARFILLNPMAQIIQDARYVLIAPENQTVWQSFSTSLVGLIPVALSVVIFIGGLVFFESCSKLFAELVK